MLLCQAFEAAIRKRWCNFFAAVEHRLVLPSLHRCSMRRSIYQGVLGYLQLSFLPALLGGCPTSGFECGTPLASDPDQTYTCSRPEEVCICATRSCARVEHPASDAAEPCSSGLRYVKEKIFVADDDLAGQCVDIAHAPTKISQPDVQSRCPGSPPLEETSGGAESGTVGSETSAGTTGASAGAMSSSAGSGSEDITSSSTDAAGASSSSGGSDTN